MKKIMLVVVVAAMVAVMAVPAAAQGGPQADCEALGGSFTTGGGKPTCDVSGWDTIQLVPGTNSGGTGGGVYLMQGYVWSYEMDRGSYGGGNTPTPTGENYCVDQLGSPIDPSNCTELGYTVG